MHQARLVGTLSLLRSKTGAESPCAMTAALNFVPAAHQLAGSPADKESEVFRPAGFRDVTNYNAVFARRGRPSYIHRQGMHVSY
jgi:hypothetical protein